jgi:hypothetical protein
VNGDVGAERGPTGPIDNLTTAKDAIDVHFAQYIPQRLNLLPLAL